MIHQFPCAFEFNSRFLRHVMRHSLYGLYGTFICNSECDRKESLVRLFTKSFWLAVGEKQEKFYNGFFTPTPGVVIPETSSRSITLWTEYYLYWYHYTIRKAGPRKALPKVRSLLFYFLLLLLLLLLLYHQKKIWHFILNSRYSRISMSFIRRSRSEINGYACSWNHTNIISHHFLLSLFIVDVLVVVVVVGQSVNNVFGFSCALRPRSLSSLWCKCLIIYLFFLKSVSFPRKLPYNVIMLL